MINCFPFDDLMYMYMCVDMHAENYVIQMSISHENPHHSFLSTKLCTISQLITIRNFSNREYSIDVRTYKFSPVKLACFTANLIVIGKEL